ncbi:MAG: hypothetical protein Q4G62_10045 [Pseudomonadota bacterium]|nr:hypothetical protein [Pseudomonadota bacterium]
MSMQHALILPLASALLLSGTAYAANPPDAADRQAILAMQGEYNVRFNFDETVVLARDYQRRELKTSGGDEVVIVVEDSPGRIVLQHLLVDTRSGHVTKHWRQDWHYQAPKRFEFSADQTWVVRDIPADTTRGAWTQCVYEVSDAPRYCGTGRWNHRYGVATWTSDRTWRPLPRREYSQRSDYNAMNVENRHTIVPTGWTHEQDNTKALRRADGSTERTLVREAGFNDYIKTDAIDFGPAYRYWQATAPYWAKVRARWQAALDGGGLHLDTKVDGMAIIIPLFEQAARVEAGEAVSDAEIEAVFTRWVKPVPAAAPR